MSDLSFLQTVMAFLEEREADGARRVELLERMQATRDFSEAHQIHGRPADPSPAREQKRQHTIGILLRRALAEARAAAPFDGKLPAKPARLA